MDNHNQRLHIHLVSDSTGQTLDYFKEAALAQYDQIQFEDHHWAEISKKHNMELALQGIADYRGIVFFTVVDREQQKRIEKHCQSINVPCLNVLRPAFDFLTGFLGVPESWEAGRQHEMDDEYFARIEAMQYTLAQDDGNGESRWHDADIIIVGVSRTSKTPTSIYLANRGLRVANIPVVPPNDLRDKLSPFKDCQKNKDIPLVVGLVRDPRSLLEIRRSRLKTSGYTHHGMTKDEYIDIEKVKEEIALSRTLCQLYRWPIIDVTHRSIEETASTILRLYEKRKDES